jgi:hypothetical protein
MSRKKDDSLWPMVMVPKKEWDALVRFFREEEKILRDSYSVPGQERRWREELENDGPRAFKIYDAARRAASRKFKR